MYNSGGDTLMAGCDAQLVIRTLRDYFQPDTFDRIFTLFVIYQDGATD